MTVLDEVLADLDAEGSALREVVAGLSESGWRTRTPATGWDIAAQVAHLTWTDETSLAAVEAALTGVTDAWDAILAQAMKRPDDFVDAATSERLRDSGSEQLAGWDESRPALARALRAVPEGRRIPWFGPPMSPTSMATARFMETWAHGLDVREALGIDPTPTDRVRHVCHLGVRTRGFAYAANGQEPPGDQPRVELAAPSGAVWAWGSEDAEQRITGSAWDFARLVTQRIHRDDTDLVADGADAAYWLRIAQAFAGPPGAGRERRGE